MTRATAQPWAEFVDNTMDPGPHNHSSDELFEPGSLVAGRYRILRRVAKGGMGLVYEAEDSELGGRVAVKALRPEVAVHTTNLARFKREINLARRVTHPNVCRIYDVGQHSDAQRSVRFLTMELLHGETLSRFLEREGPLSTEAVLPLVAQILSGLAAAHDAGVVHRDFKPSNVILVDTPKGLRAVITDFGLSAPIEEGQDASRLTAAGQLMGTLAYLSPEQLEGKACTPASDLYAFGCVFYRMVTGVLPFNAGTPLMAALSRLNEDPRPPREIRPQIPSEIEDVILRCLARDACDRFPWAGDVLMALGLDATRDTTTTLLRPTASLLRPRQAPSHVLRRWARPWALFALLIATAAVAWFLPGFFAWDLPRPSSVTLREPELEGFPPPVARRLAGIIHAALVAGVDGLALPRISQAGGALSSSGNATEELRARVVARGDERELFLERFRKGARVGLQTTRLPLGSDVAGLHLRIQAALYSLYPELNGSEPGDLLALARLHDLTNSGDAGLPWQDILVDLAQRRERLCRTVQAACLEAFLLEARICRYLGRRHDQPELIERAFELAAAATHKFPADAAPILAELDLALRTRQPARVETALANLESLPAEFAWAPLLGRAMASKTCEEWSTALRLIRDQSLLATDRYRQLLIRLLIDARCEAEALAQVRLVLEQDPGNSLALEFRAELALKRGDEAAAMADYEALIATPLGRRNRDARSNLALLRLFGGRYAEAAAEFAEINHLYPGDPTVLLNEADARRLLGEEDAARRLYRKVVTELAGRQVLSPRALALKAQALAQLGEAAEAAEVVVELLRQSPEDGQAHYSAALVATLAGDQARARREATRARELGVPIGALNLPFFARIAPDRIAPDRLR